RAFASHPKITIPFRASNSTHVFHQYTLILHDVDRDALQHHLADKKIPSMIYYPLPAHKQKMFEIYQTGSLDLEITDWLNKRVISLPIHTELDEEQLKYITDSVLEFVNK
ncbi:MAG TPA: DegT/DnrJ/EryC1/StrS family aminotransferase, partial [Niabella sp.]|nr:DegT/DnrJ/EryC1/StrS family aminotransferase [Niabella sp.]